MMNKFTSTAIRSCRCLVMHQRLGSAKNGRHERHGQNTSSQRPDGDVACCYRRRQSRRCPLWRHARNGMGDCHRRRVGRDPLTSSVVLYRANAFDSRFGNWSDAGSANAGSSAIDILDAWPMLRFASARPTRIVMPFRASVQSLTVGVVPAAYVLVRKLPGHSMSRSVLWSRRQGAT